MKKKKKDGIKLVDEQQKINSYEVIIKSTTKKT